MKNNSRFNMFLSGIILLLALSFFVVYANSDVEISYYGYTLKKNKDLCIDFFNNETKKPTLKPKKVKPIIKIDTTSQRFLIIGDSQVEGLRDPLYDYCKRNGHEIALALTWYSSTDMTYASNDTLKNMVKEYKPTHILFVIGLNQIYQSNFDASEKSIDSIVSSFNGIPYSWIGPANWTEDKGINKLYEENIDRDCFFSSKKLVLDRAKDGRHPSYKANFVWMDSIAKWMEKKSKWHIKMAKPDSLEKKRFVNSKMYTVGK